MNVKGFDPTTQRAVFAADIIGKGKLVLDIGCGTGEFGKIFEGRGNTVYGIDIDRHCIKEAKKKLTKAFVRDIRKVLDFKDSMFDAVFAGEFIEHFTMGRGLEILRECHRVLKENGTIILTTPNTSFPKHTLVKTNTYGIAGHKKCYGSKELKGLVTKAGFRLKGIVGLGAMKHLWGGTFPLFCYGDMGLVAVKGGRLG